VPERIIRPDETVFLTNAAANILTVRHPTSDAREQWHDKT
jgi:hypothetical protein